jgi:hypothetical protein
LLCYGDIVGFSMAKTMWWWLSKGEIDKVYAIWVFDFSLFFYH